MRTLPAAILSLGALLAPAVAAQEEGCVQSSPCDWSVLVDADGFAGDSDWNFTQGDWFTLTAYSDDAAAHTLALEGYGVTLSLEPYGEASRTLQLSQAGEFALVDQPSGERAAVTVLAADVVDYEKGLVDETGGTGGASGATSPGRGAPGLPLALPLLALAFLAAARRR